MKYVLIIIISQYIATVEFNSLKSCQSAAADMIEGRIAIALCYPKGAE